MSSGGVAPSQTWRFPQVRLGLPYRGSQATHRLLWPPLGHAAQAARYQGLALRHGHRCGPRPIPRTARPGLWMNAASIRCFARAACSTIWYSLCPMLSCVRWC